MPELPEVEGLSVRLPQLQLEEQLRSKQYRMLIRLNPKEQGKEAILKGMQPKDFIRNLQGMRIENITRRSKYIYFH